MLYLLLNLCVYDYPKVLSSFACCVVLDQFVSTGFLSHQISKMSSSDIVDPVLKGNLTSHLVEFYCSWTGSQVISFELLFCVLVFN